MNRAVNFGLWSLAALLSVAVAVVSFRYLPRVGPMPSSILGNAFANPWLSLHVAGAATALLISPFQFIRTLRANSPGVHRWLGRVYVLGCMLGGAAGLVLAPGSTAGPIASLGFGLLAVIWLFVTSRAWLLAWSGRYADHRRWMIRSFALTFAAVTLRLYLPLSQVMGLSFMESYRVIAFMAWVPNLAVAELYLRTKPGRRMASAAA